MERVRLYHHLTGLSTEAKRVILKLHDRYSRNDLRRALRLSDGQRCEGYIIEYSREHVLFGAAGGPIFPDPPPPYEIAIADIEMIVYYSDLLATPTWSVACRLFDRLA